MMRFMMTMTDTPTEDPFVLCMKSGVDVRKLSKQVLKNEPKIIKEHPPTTRDGFMGGGNTKMGYHSLTARSYHYNVLKWWGTGPIKKAIRKGYEAYTGIKGKRLYAQCWANVMRNGEKIYPHKHIGYSKEKISLLTTEWDVPFTACHLSAHLCVQVDGSTSTYYNGKPILNEEGVFSFFPGTVMHWTDRYMGEGERITLACDINTKEFFDYDQNQKPTWIEI